MSRPRKKKSNLPPCCYLKHGAYWLVKANKWTKLGTDLPSALAEYGRLVEADRIGGMPKLIEEFHRQLPATLSESTKQQYRYAANILARKLRQFDPKQVKGKTVSQIRKSLAKTPNMANRVLSYLRQFFTWAVDEEHVDNNPCIGIKRMEEAKRRRLINDKEWRAIHAEADPRLRVIMELQHLTGQRISDVLSIRRSQIGEEGIAFEQKKTKARLLVRWSPDLRATVAAAMTLHDGKPETLTLLRGRWGGAPDYRSVVLQWRRACDTAGVEDARLNDGRAKSATGAKREGKDPTSLLGHTTPAHTQRYLRDRETPEVDGPSLPGNGKNIRQGFSN